MINLKKRARGISLIEVVVSLVITSVLISAAMRSMTAAKRREQRTLSESSYHFLANELMNEIQLQPSQSRLQ